MCLKSNTFQLDSSSTMNIWSLVVDINFTLGLVCPITFASLQARVRFYTGVSVHGGKLTGTSYGGGGWPGPFGPPSVSAPAGKLSEHAVLCGGDIKQLVEILLSLLSTTCPAFLFACERLRDIAVGVDRVERKGDCYSLSEMKGLLDGLQQTAEYHCCPRGRQLVKSVPELKSQ